MCEKPIENEIIGLREIRGLSFPSFSIENRSLWDGLDEKIRKEILNRAEDIEFSSSDYITLSLPDRRRDMVASWRARLGPSSP